MPRGMNTNSHKTICIAYDNLYKANCQTMYFVNESSHINIDRHSIERRSTPSPFVPLSPPVCRKGVPGNKEAVKDVGPFHFIWMMRESDKGNTLHSLGYQKLFNCGMLWMQRNILPTYSPFLIHRPAVYQKFQSDHLVVGGKAGNSMCFLRDCSKSCALTPPGLRTT